MDPIATAGATLALVLIFLGTGTWVFSALLLVSVSALVFLLDFSPARLGSTMQAIVWRSSTTWELAAIPMFIWMGEIILRTDLAVRLFKALTPLVDAIPGRLLHTNVTGCTLFAAVSGSSAATTATVGKITVRELTDQRYNSNLMVGSLAGAGSLGLLIPPSLVMIIYGVLAEVSIARLFAAGIVPGLFIAFLYAGYIGIRCWLNPELAPQHGTRYSFAEKISASTGLIPISLLICIVLGGIYTGFATPSEAAALGVTATLIMAAVMRQLNWTVITDSVMNAVSTSCMICSLLVSAALLSTAVGYLHIPADLANWIEQLNLSPYSLIFVLAIFYIILGFFLDGVSITVMSLPITLPLAVNAGFDPVWFGVFLVVMVELAQITPPVGFNLFVIQGITGMPIGAVAKAAFPFFILMCLAITVMTIYPQIVLFVPDAIYNK